MTFKIHVRLTSKLFLILPLFLIFGAVAPASAQNSDYTALYRLFNPQSSDHLYTTDCAEKDNLLRSGGWTYEGVTGYVSVSQRRNTVPLYRLLLTNGAHFYTSDYNEMINLADAGNRSEGIVGYVSNRQARNTAPLYRLLSGERHLYTTSEQERNSFLQNRDARSETSPGYLWTFGTNSCDWGNAADQNSFPVIYAGANYNGAAEALERDKTELNDWDGSPHTIRSIRVPQGWYLVLYTRKNYRGRSYNVNSNITFAPGDEWYNNIRSVRVYRGNPPIQPR